MSYPALTEHAPFLVGLRDRPEFKELLDPVRQRWLGLLEWERKRLAAPSPAPL